MLKEMTAEQWHTVIDPDPLGFCTGSFTANIDFAINRSAILYDTPYCDSLAEGGGLLLFIIP